VQLELRVLIAPSFILKQLSDKVEVYY